MIVQREIEIEEEDVIEYLKDCSANKIYDLCIKATSQAVEIELRELFQQ
jgi:hypothetical protein